MKCMLIIVSAVYVESLAFGSLLSFLWAKKPEPPEEDPLGSGKLQTSMPRNAKFGDYCIPSQADCTGGITIDDGYSCVCHGCACQDGHACHFAGSWSGGKTQSWICCDGDLDPESRNCTNTK